MTPGGSESGTIRRRSAEPRTGRAGGGAPGADPRRVFVLGAGFSYAAGLPLAYQLLTGVFARLGRAEQERLLGALGYLYPKFAAATSRPARRGVDPGPARALEAVPVEEFMSLLDVSERFSARLPSTLLSPPDIRELRRDLLRGIAGLFFEQHVRAEGVAGRLDYIHRFVAQLRPHDTVVTFNWDTLVERSARQQDLDVDLVGRQPVSARRRTVLKLHGSVDWYDAADVQAGVDRQAVHRQIHRVAWDALVGAGSAVRASAAPFVMPPTFFKDLLGSTDLEELWAAAYERLAAADEVHFCGYRLPPEDLFARAMLRRALRANVVRREREGLPPPQVTAVNPDPAVAASLRLMLYPKVTAVREKFQESRWARPARTARR